MRIGNVLPHIQRPSVPFQPKNRRERVGMPRANRKFESTFPTAAVDTAAYVFPRHPHLRATTATPVHLEICDKRQREDEPGFMRRYIDKFPRRECD